MPFHWLSWQVVCNEIHQQTFLFQFSAIGKLCATNADCYGVGDTSCVKDYDYKLRCLCGDFRPPNNGICSAKMKGLRHQCRRNEECEDYMICRENNITKVTLGSLAKDVGNRDRLCLCDEDNGYMENIIENHCNGKKAWCDVRVGTTYHVVRD